MQYKVAMIFYYKFTVPMTYVYNSPVTYFFAVPKSITLIFDYGSVDANIIFEGFISLKIY